MENVAFVVACLMLGGCSSVPLGPEPGEESIDTIQEEVLANTGASERLRLISRLYVGDYAALEWYQPVAGVIGFSIVQDARYEAIDKGDLRELKPSQVFKRFARSLDVPEALQKLEQHPEVLQELRSADAIEAFAPELDLQRAGVRLQADFRVSRGEAAFACSWQNFHAAYCSSWDVTECYRDRTSYIRREFEDVDENQASICTCSGTSQLSVQIFDCHTITGTNEGANRCSGKAVLDAGRWFTVGLHRARSWHGVAQTYVGIDDPYTFMVEARPTAGTPGMFQLQNRWFWD